MSSKLIKISELDQMLNDNKIEAFLKPSPYSLLKCIKSGQIRPLIGMANECKDTQLATRILYENINFEESNKFIYIGQPTTDQLLENFKNGDVIYAVFDYVDDTASRLLYDELFDRVLFRHKLDDSFITLAMAIIHGVSELSTNAVRVMKLAARNYNMSEQDATFANQVFSGKLKLYLDAKPDDKKIIPFSLEDEDENDFSINNINAALTLDDVDGYHDIVRFSYELEYDILVQYDDLYGDAKLYPITKDGYSYIMKQYFDVVHQNGLEFKLIVQAIESIEDLIKVLNGTYNELNRDPFDEDQFQEVCEVYCKEFGLVE